MSDDDASSCTSSGASADDHIECADLLPIRQCGSLLTTLVSLLSSSSTLSGSPSAVATPMTVIVAEIIQQASISGPVCDVDLVPCS